MKFTTNAPEEHRGSARTNPNREPTQEEIFRFLEMLRGTGKCNMLDAPNYVEFYLDIPRQQAKEVFWEWVDYVDKQVKLERLLRS